jgi:hypothetical protein
MAVKKTNNTTGKKQLSEKSSTSISEYKTQRIQEELVEGPKEIRQIWLEDYLSLKDFKYHPATNSFFERLAQEFMDWSDKSTSLVLVEFYSEKKIPKDTFIDWFQKYPVMNKAHQYAKQKITARKEIGAIERKYDGNFVKESLYMHDGEWREFMKFKKDLEKEHLENQKIEVHLSCKRSHTHEESKVINEK